MPNRIGVRLARSFGSAWVAGAALTLALVAPVGRAQGQQVAAYLVGYQDGDETSLALAGALLRRGGLGLQPVASLEAFVLGYEGGDGSRATLWTVSPGVGLMYAGINGAASGRVSYQFVTDEEATGFFTGGGSGPALTLQGQYWGARPAVEALLSHNFGANFLWTQLQAYLPVIPVPPGSIDVGAEYVWQGDLDDADTRAQLFGPLVRWSTGRGIFTTLSGGLKNNLGPADNTWYARAALVYAP